jgi:hypothetical protein
VGCGKEDKINEMNKGETRRRDNYIKTQGNIRLRYFIESSGF